MINSHGRTSLGATVKRNDCGPSTPKGYKVVDVGATELCTPDRRRYCLSRKVWTITTRGEAYTALSRINAATPQ